MFHHRGTNFIFIELWQTNAQVKYNYIVHVLQKVI